MKTVSSHAILKNGARTSGARRVSAPGKRVPQPVSRLADVLHAEPLALHTAVMQGLAYDALEEFRRTFELTLSEAIRVVQIPERTLARRREAGRLHPQESDRLVRIARLFAQATRLFNGNTTEARAWLSRPQRVLGSAVPLELAATEIGAQEVERALLRIEHGVFA
jgi:putative toxin-antitoxin system antitoxin component (TIGR02293 family)